MLAPSWYPDDKQLRQFAVISLFGFGLLGVLARFALQSELTSYVLWLLGTLTFLLGLASPRTILPVYAALMLAAYPVGWVTSAILLRVMYYGILTPDPSVDGVIEERRAALERVLSELQGRARTLLRRR